MFTGTSKSDPIRRRSFLKNWVAQPPLFGQWFERIILLQMPQLCWCSILNSWNRCHGSSAYISCRFRSSPSVSNQILPEISFPPSKRYVTPPPPFPKKTHKPPNKSRPILTILSTGDNNHHPHPHPPSPSTWCNQPTKRCAPQNLHALGSNNYWSRSFSASDVPLGSCGVVAVLLGGKERREFYCEGLDFFEICF